MANEFLEFINSKQATGGSTNPFLAGILSSGRGRKRITDEQLATQVSELEAIQQQTGARDVEQDKPGALARIIDFLSRPNFAIAGLTEELLGEEPSVTRGVKRALTEIFSGVGGLQGEKRAFGEVLENLGVGTKTLADAFPALEGTWVGAMGSRGAAGIALDIATDPLTYMTFGASTGMRIATSKGVKFLNKAGKDAFGDLFRKNLEIARQGKRADDAVETTRIFDQALNATEKEFEAVHGLTSEFLEKGGAKIFGAQIPLSDKLGVPLKKALSMLPEGVVKPAVEGAELMQQGMKRAINGIFSPEGALANLPEPIRTRAVRLTNSFFRSSTAHRSNLMIRKVDLEERFKALKKKKGMKADDMTMDERWYDVREGVPGAAITDPEELALWRETMDFYDSMGQTLVDHGVFDAAKFRQGYMYHVYENIEDLAQYHSRPGQKINPGSKSNIEKERRFDGFKVAEEESKRKHELQLRLLSRGELKDAGLYPILKPRYDVFGNMQEYIGQHADVLARKAWREEMVSQFGKQADELGILDPSDYDALYDDATKGIPTKDTPGAPKDFAPERVPLRRSIDEGDIEETLRDVFGPDGAQYVAVKGKQTGDHLVYLPKTIADALDDVNASLFNTREYKEFGKLLRGFDWLNNNFKWGVYTVWPASATRDAYSNLALSMLRIGVAAIDPKKHIDTIRMMAGRDLGRQFANSGFTIGQLRDLSKTLGVWVPGQVFVEQTGRFKLGKFRRALTEKRAGIENEARVQLWLEEIRRGADPRSAADTVGRFLFNYGEVSRVERDLFRRLIPFYTFTRKNVERQWKTLRSKPGLAINQLKPFRGRKDENEMMVKYEAEGLKLRLDRDGKSVHVLTGVDLPLRNLDTIWAGGVGSTGRRLMGMITPVIKAPLETVVGRDLFTGGDLKRTRADTLGRIVDMTNTPKAVKDWLGYKKTFDDAGRPRYEMDGARYHMLARSWMFSRAFSTSDRAFRENYLQDGNLARGMLDFLTGMRVKEIDLDEQGRRKMQRRFRQLQDSLGRRGALPQWLISGKASTEGLE